MPRLAHHLVFIRTPETYKIKATQKATFHELGKITNQKKPLFKIPKE